MLRLSIAILSILCMISEAAKGDPPISTKKFEPLPGRAVGILVFDTEQLCAREKRTGPPDAVAFVRGTGRFRWMYVPAPGDPEADEMTFATSKKGESKTYPHVRIGTPELLTKWELKGPYCLVEVEVNDGLGSSAEESFVATSIRRVDGTQAFPLQIEEIMKDVKKDLDKQAKGEIASIQKLIRQTRDQVSKGRDTTNDDDETTDEVLMTWLPKEEQLRVEYIRQITNGFYVFGQGADGPKPQKPIRAGTEYGVECKAEALIDKSGKVVRKTPLKLTTLTRELQLPE